MRRSRDRFDIATDRRSTGRETRFPESKGKVVSGRVAVCNIAVRSAYKMEYRRRETAMLVRQAIERHIDRRKKEKQAKRQAKKLQRKYEFRAAMMEPFIGRKMAREAAFKGVYQKHFNQIKKEKIEKLRAKGHNYLSASMKVGWDDYKRQMKTNVLAGFVGERNARRVINQREREQFYNGYQSQRNSWSKASRDQLRAAAWREIERHYPGRARDLFKRTQQSQQNHEAGLKQLDSELSALRASRQQKKPASATGLNSRMGQNGVRFGMHEDGMWSREKLAASMFAKAKGEGRKRDVEKEVQKREEWIREELVPRGLAKEVTPGRYHIDQEGFSKAIGQERVKKADAKASKDSKRIAERAKLDREYESRFVDRKFKTKRGKAAFTDAEMDTMRDLGRYQMLTQKQVASLHYSRPQGGSYSDLAAQDLQRLGRSGMIGHRDIITKSGAQRVYFLKEGKGRTLNAIDGTSEKYRTGGWSKESKQFEHDSLIPEAVADLVGEGEARGWSVSKIFTEDDLKDHARAGAEVGLQAGDDVPDAIVILEKAEGEGEKRQLTVAVEVDCGYDEKTIQSKQSTFESRGMETAWYSDSKGQSSRVRKALGGKSFSLKTRGKGKGVWR